MEGGVSIIGQIMAAPKDVYILILGTCDCVILYRKRDFADGIILGILRWRNCLGFSGWAQCNYKHVSKRKAGESVREKRLAGARLLALKIEKGASSPGRQAAPGS